MVMIGTKRARITIERRTAGADTYGDMNAESWAELMTVWASVTASSAAESIEQDSTQGRITQRFYIRYSASANGIRDSDRITYDGRTYNITGIMDRDGRKRELQITATADT